jgi:hypothetical protein
MFRILLERCTSGWAPSGPLWISYRTRASGGKALEWGKANGDIAEDITAYGKSLGQIGHKMLTDGKDLVVIDEWPDADAFNKFFAGAARMGEFLSGAGVTGEPEVTMLDAVDVAGQF